VLVVLAALALPLVVGDRFWLNLLTLSWINLIAVLGLVLLFGHANQISFGHAAFVGIGAYVSGLTTIELGFSLLVSVPLAMAVGWVVGYALARPVLRLHGVALAMATLALGELFFVVFRELSITGGANGLPGIPGLALGPIDLTAPDAAYWGTLVVALVTATLCHNVIRSRVGRCLRAIGSSPTAATTSGIDASAYKAGIFAFSTSLASLSGALYAHYVTFVSSASFGLPLSILLVIMVVVGGLKSLWGAAAATVGLTVLPGYLGGYGEYSGLIYGALLVVTFMYLPGGVAGLVERLAAAVPGLDVPKRPRRSTPVETP
jgi:branched-chain amino acid transport system permease protein